MSKISAWLAAHWKLVLNIVTIIALVVLVFAIRHQLGQTIRDFYRINAWALLLILPVQFLNYDAQARLYQGLFKVVGVRLRYWFLYRASLELNFVNHVFPSGGVTGISYFGLRMRNGEVTGAKATVVQLLKLVMLVVSFEILIVLGVFFLALEGHMNSLVLLLAGSITTVLVIGTGLFAYIIGSKRRITSFFKLATRAINRIISVVRPSGNIETINIGKAEKLFEDLHDNYVLFRSDWRELRWPFWWAFMANVWEIMTIYVVYFAFGDLVNVGAVILAYAVANFAGLISVLPGGVGIYEGLMTLVLSATGVPSKLSLPVTVMYRVISTLVQLPPGYYFYHKTLQESGREKPV